MNIKKTSLGLILGAAVIFASCESNTTTSDAKEAPTEEHDHHDQEAIELDKGKKWKVIDKMLGYIRLMEADVNDAQNMKGKEYETLAGKLQTNVDLLTSSCTMTGKAHDELHKWLLPYIDLVDELANAENDTEAQETYISIQASFKTFNTYFE